MKVTQQQKAVMFDWMLKLIDSGQLELLFKADDSGEHDYFSCSHSSDFFEYFINENQQVEQ